MFSLRSSLHSTSSTRFPQFLQAIVIPAFSKLSRLITCTIYERYHILQRSSWMWSPQVTLACIILMITTLLQKLSFTSPARTRAPGQKGSVRSVHSSVLSTAPRQHPAQGRHSTLDGWKSKDMTEQMTEWTKEQRTQNKSLEGGYKASIWRQV